MRLIDSHCHLDAAEFADRQAEIITAAREAGVAAMVVPGIMAAGWEKIMALCRQHQGLFCAPGLHPLFLTAHRDDHLLQLGELSGQPGVVAIGEIGLDFYHRSADRRGQQRLLQQQLEIAAKARLPVLLHVRKAHDQMLSILRQKKFSEGGIVHAFGGSYQQAKHYCDLGFCIGVGGTISYDRAQKVRRIVSELPGECLVLETDSPDMPLAGRREAINQPKFLREILATLAALRQESLETVARQTTANCEKILNIV